jgi:Sugar phosphate isomerases/epimerases
MNRRQTLQTFAAATGLALTPLSSSNSVQKRSGNFKYCLNTSTLNVQQNGLKKVIELTARAGYDMIELWIPDLQKYTAEGNSLSSLNKFIRDSGLGVANAIGFAPWMLADDAMRRKGFEQMEAEMNIMAEVGCTRIAAAPAGLKPGDAVDLLAIGGYLKKLIALGKKTGVMPQLEFWGVSPVFYHIGQVLMVAAAANDPDVRILADVFHLFRGGSGFDGLRLVNGNHIDIFHMNDYPDTPREEQKDKDRIFPGDGVAPMKQIVQTLAATPNTKILSLELFNPEYWKRDPLEVAKTGLTKMKDAVKLANS